jgi:hypothetical protein
VGDAPSWPPSYFDIFEPDGPGTDPAAALRFIIEDMANDARLTPDWLIEGRDLKVQLSAISYAPGLAQIGFTAGEAQGAVTLTPDPSGWLRIEATCGGAVVFRAFLDRVYQEFELWPSGAAKSDEAPGRMGKRRNWLSLDVEAWPALKPLVNEGRYLNLTAVE